MGVVIREATADEIDLLADVERDGDRRYAGYEGVPVGFDDVVSATVLAEAADDGRLWVAVSGSATATGTESGNGEIIGFALAETIDGQGHLAQVSVRRRAQGQGIGRRLIDAVCRWAGAQSMTSVSLCTFSDVEWNRPLYEHLGFVVVPEESWSPGLRSTFENDGRLGLDLRRRVVMAKDLPAG
jgi:GNAT superfamily N-acetyltransferase